MSFIFSELLTSVIKNYEELFLYASLGFKYNIYFEIYSERGSEMLIRFLKCYYEGLVPHLQFYGRSV